MSAVKHERDRYRALLERVVDPLSSEDIAELRGLVAEDERLNAEAVERERMKRFGAMLDAVQAARKELGR